MFKFNSIPRILKVHDQLRFHHRVGSDADVPRLRQVPWSSGWCRECWQSFKCGVSGRETLDSERRDSIWVLASREDGWRCPWVWRGCSLGDDGPGAELVSDWQTLAEVTGSGGWGSRGCLPSVIWALVIQPRSFVWFVRNHVWEWSMTVLTCSDLHCASCWLVHFLTPTRKLMRITIYVWILCCAMHLRAKHSVHQNRVIKSRR
jgi:hypothetical protein